jgi:hypothetical protein
VGNRSLFPGYFGEIHHERLFLDFLWGKLIKKRKQLDNTVPFRPY